MPKLLFTPVCAQEGGSTWTQPFLSTFPKNFGTKLVPYLYTAKTTTNQQKEHSEMFRFKMTAKKKIFVLRKKSRDQNVKNHFPKGIFQ